MFLSHKSWLLPAKLLCISIQERLIVAAEDEFAHSLLLLSFSLSFFFFFFLITSDAYQGDNIFYPSLHVIICFGFKSHKWHKESQEVVVCGPARAQA